MGRDKHDAPARRTNDRSMSESGIEWRIDAANSRILRHGMYGWIGLTGAVMLLLFGVAVLMAANAAMVVFS